MWIINSIAGFFINAALYPFRSLPPMVGLSVFSLISGVAMLYAFKYTSDQDGLDRVKRKIHAGIFEIRLFNDDMWAILAAQRDILRYNVSYLRLALTPVLWMAIPFVLMVAQLQLHYGYEGLTPGESVIVKVTLADAAADTGGAGSGTSMPDISIEVPPGLRVETPRLWIPSLHEADWRIVADEPGAYEISIQVGAETYTKSVVVSSAVLLRSPIRANALLDQILFPGEPAFPSGAPVSAIAVMYPERTLNFFGWQTHWLIPYMIITIVLAFALKKPLGVTF